MLRSKPRMISALPKLFFEAGSVAVRVAHDAPPLLVASLPCFLSARVAVALAIGQARSAFSHRHQPRHQRSGLSNVSRRRSSRCRQMAPVDVVETSSRPRRPALSNRSPREQRLEIGMTQALICLAQLEIQARDHRRPARTTGEETPPWIGNRCPHKGPSSVERLRTVCSNVKAMPR